MLGVDRQNRKAWLKDLPHHRGALLAAQKNAFSGMRLASTCVWILVAASLATVSARAESPSLPPPNSTTSTQKILSQDGSGLPTHWGKRDNWVAPAWYGLSIPEELKSTAEARLGRALSSLPHVFLTVSREDLFGAERGLYLHTMESGEDWERPVRMEYRITPSGPGFQIDAGLRIQGGWNRRPEESPKHSFRLVFRSKYGHSKLHYPLFPEGKPAVDQLILRAGNNHSWLHWDGKERRTADYLRDPWMRATHAAMGYPAARSRPVHLHLNGLYWGVYDLAERPDSSFAARAWGGKPDDYDSRNADKVLSGDAQAWDQLLARVNAGVTNEVSYAAVRAELDVPAFIDFMLLNLYGANGDWDRSSNWYAARRRNPAGPWRFLVWDGERTLESPTDNRLAEEDDLSPTRIFQKMRAWPAFRKEFAQRARLHLAPGSPLSSESAALRYQRLSERLEPALFAEAVRWGDYRRSLHPYKEGPYETYTVENHWRPEVQRILKEYFPARPGAFILQLKEAGLWDWN